VSEKQFSVRGGFSPRLARSNRTRQAAPLTWRTDRRTWRRRRRAADRSASSPSPCAVIRHPRLAHARSRKARGFRSVPGEAASAAAIASPLPKAASCDSAACGEPSLAPSPRDVAHASRQRRRTTPTATPQTRHRCLICTNTAQKVIRPLTRAFAHSTRVGDSTRAGAIFGIAKNRAKLHCYEAQNPAGASETEILRRENRVSRYASFPTNVSTKSHWRGRKNPHSP
jgi:hypothetical protein